jgi:hypothetical protein
MVSVGLLERCPGLSARQTLISFFHLKQFGAVSMAGNASTTEPKTQAISVIHPNWLPDDEIERELHIVEELILAFHAADAFVEDLVSLHMRRNALLATLAIQRAKERGSVVDLVSWRKRAMQMSHLAEESVVSVEIECVQEESGHER